MSWSSFTRNCSPAPTAIGYPKNNPARVNLDAIAGVRRDDRAAAAMLLHAEVPLASRARAPPGTHLVEGDADVVDTWDAPVARLDDDVDGARSSLRQRTATVALELLPETRPRLRRDRRRPARRVRRVEKPSFPR